MKITKEDLISLGEETKYPLESLEDIEFAVSQLEQRKDLPFGVYVRGSSDGMDFWLQVEYWSKKLQKTIIWEYDWQSSFDNEDDLLEAVNRTLEEVLAFEKRITLQK